MSPKISDARVINGNTILVRVPGSSKKLVLYECIMPYYKSESFLDNFNFKFPMFIIAFVIVVLYQFYKKKKDSVDENDGDLVRKFGKNQNLSSKAKNDLN